MEEHAALFSVCAPRRCGARPKKKEKQPKERPSVCLPAASDYALVMQQYKQPKKSVAEEDSQALTHTHLLRRVIYNARALRQVFTAPFRASCDFPYVKAQVRSRQAAASRHSGVVQAQRSA